MASSPFPDAEVCEVGDVAGGFEAATSCASLENTAATVPVNIEIVQQRRRAINLNHRLLRSVPGRSHNGHDLANGVRSLTSTAPRRPKKTSILFTRHSRRDCSRLIGVRTGGAPPAEIAVDFIHRARH
jgi:hypothetical protein